MCGYPFDNWMVVESTIATDRLSKERTMMVHREIEIEATPEEVWDALATEEGRERWLDEPDREIWVESEDAPRRLVWWWWEGESDATRVEFLVVAAPVGSRVIVIEAEPARVPVTALAMCLTAVLA
jgi:uncharacterized protein YndB with AHSA1/START domain